MHKQPSRIGWSSDQSYDLQKDRAQHENKVRKIFEHMLKTFEQMLADKGVGPPVLDEKKVLSSMPGSVRSFSLRWTRIGARLP